MKAPVSGRCLESSGCWRAESAWAQLYSYTPGVSAPGQWPHRDHQHRNTGSHLPSLPATSYTPYTCQLSCLYPVWTVQRLLPDTVRKYKLSIYLLTPDSLTQTLTIILLGILYFVDQDSWQEGLMSGLHVWCNSDIEINKFVRIICRPIDCVTGGFLLHCCRHWYEQMRRVAWVRAAAAAFSPKETEASPKVTVAFCEGC